MGDVTDARASVWRWRPAFQADSQARLDRCVAEKANRNPVAVLNGDRSHRVLELTTRPGETVRLSAKGTDDPDGERVHARWSVYREAGTFPGDVRLSADEGLSTSFVAPRATEPQTVHVILEVRDNGTPGLVAFRRAIVQILLP